MANEQASSNGNMDTGTLQAGNLLTKDYEQIIESRQVTESVIANLGLMVDGVPMTSGQLRGLMSVNTPDQTRVIGITVTADDPYVAADICDEIRSVAINRIQEVMDMKSVKVVENANIPTGPESPNPKKNAVIGALLCALLCMAIVVGASLANNTIRSQEDIEKYLGLSVLGSIPYDSAVTGESRRKRRFRRIMGDRS